MLRIFHNTAFDFIKWWRLAAILTIAFIALGLGSFLVKRQMNLSIEFAGGTLMQLEFKEPPNVAELRRTADRVSPGAEIQQFGSAREYTVRASARSCVGERSSRSFSARSSR
jgi:preprotein translocase subunit SecF